MFDVFNGIPNEKKDLGLISYAQCSNGTFLIRAAGCGFITTKTEGIPSMPVGNESISILPKKLPISIFNKILSFFQFVESSFNNKQLEAFILVIYDKKIQDFVLYVPKQEISAASVKYDLEEVKKLYPDGVILLDCHSHGSGMGAFFSTVDNKDDKNKDRYSAVIGKINNAVPEFKIRFSSLGKFYNISMSEIFTENSYDIPLDFKDSISRISKITFPMIIGSHNFKNDNDIFSIIDNIKTNVFINKKINLYNACKRCIFYDSDFSITDDI